MQIQQSHLSDVSIAPGHQPQHLCLFGSIFAVFVL